MAHYLQCQGHSEGLDKIYIIKTQLYFAFEITAMFTTKGGFVTQHLKPECPVEKLDYCVEGQGHSKGSKCQ